MPFGCLLAACVSAQVDAYASAQVNPQQVHQVAPLNSGLWPDLQFQEVSGEVRNALKLSGFKVGEPAQPPEVVVLVEYGIGPPRTEVRTYSAPVYKSVDRAVGPTTVHQTPGGNLIVNTPTVSDREVVGTETGTTTTTTYQRHISFAAYDYLAFKQSQAQKQLWRVTVVSEGSSSDLRSILPAMIAAAEPYLGKSSGAQVSVKLKLNGAEVEAVRTGATVGKP